MGAQGHLSDVNVPSFLSLTVCVQCWFSVSWRWWNTLSTVVIHIWRSACAPVPMWEAPRISWFLSLARPSPGHCDYLGSKPAGGRSVCISSSLCNSTFQANKTKPWREEKRKRGEKKKEKRKKIKKSCGFHCQVLSVWVVSGRKILQIGSLNTGFSTLHFGIWCWKIPYSDNCPLDCSLLSNIPALCPLDTPSIASSFFFFCTFWDHQKCLQMLPKEHNLSRNKIMAISESFLHIGPSPSDP